MVGGQSNCLGELSVELEREVYLFNRQGNNTEHLLDIKAMVLSIYIIWTFWLKW